MQELSLDFRVKSRLDFRVNRNYRLNLDSHYIYTYILMFLLSKFHPRLRVAAVRIMLTAGSLAKAIH